MTIFLDWFGADVFRCLDGPVWSSKTLPASTIYTTNSVAVGGGVAVAVSNSGGVPYAVYSLDAGDTWSAATVNGFTPGSGGGYEATYGGGWFFAVVNAIRGMRSNDGQTWEAVTLPSTIAASSGYAFGNFFVIGVSNTNGIIYSPEAATSTWTILLATLPTYTGALTPLSATDSVAMFGGNDGSGGYVIKTTDGVTWTRKSAPWSALGIRNMTNNGSRFVAIGNGVGTNSDAGYYSDDNGDTWNSMSLVGSGISSNDWRGIVYNGGIFIAVSANRTDVSVSEDGVNWRLSPNPMVAGGATCIAAVENNYIAQRTATTNTIRVGRCTG